MTTHAHIWSARIVAALAGSAALLVASPGAASAHPLGNFTVNRYSGLIVSADDVTVDHVLDLAEIPTAQRRPAIDTSDDGNLSRTELTSWARTTCGDAAKAMRLTVRDDRVPLTVGAARARTLPGQAGLPVLRVECGLRADLAGVDGLAGERGLARSAGPAPVRLVDTAGRGEVGWREMTARGDGTTLTRSDVPRRSASDRLTRYPDDLLSDPLDVVELRLAVRPGGPALRTAGVAGTAGADLPGGPLARGADRLTTAFEGLLEKSDDGPLLGLVALLGAIVLGAAHAVAPGHGKTIMAFYLSGSREGALRSAATVGATVTATHTVGVLALGLAAGAGTAFAPASVYPWLGLVSGLLVVAVGLTLLRAAAHGSSAHTHGTAPGQHTHSPRAAHSHTPSTVRGDHAKMVGASSPSPRPAAMHRSAAGDHATLGILVRDDQELAVEHREHHGHEHHAPDHEHPHEHRHDPHEHPHPHPHNHDHAQEAVAPSRRGLVAMGLAGGLLPSPSALIVFLGALAVGRPWFGVALVVAFGIGMAVTLAAVGLLVMRLRERAERRLGARPHSGLTPLLRAVPLLTAATVVVLGAVLALRGLSATDIV